MNKKDMIKVIKENEQMLFDRLIKCVEIYGEDHYMTNIATAEWHSIRELMRKLELL